VRTGQEYRESLRDGRRIWLLGEGPIDDVATHPATAAMVDAYAAWYDRHWDPVWEDRLLTAAEPGQPRLPRAFEIPRQPEDLRMLGKAIHDVAFVSAGNITHTPGYGALIALGILDAVKTLDLAPERIAAAESFRNLIAGTGLFVTFSGGAPPPADRFRPPADRAAVRLVRDTDGGVIVSGMAGLHTSVPFADEVFIAAGMASPQIEHRVWCSVPVGAPGVRVVARKPVARHGGASSPLGSRYDELDAQLWLEDVFVPWDRVFALRFEPSAGRDDARRRDGIVSWLLWHQLEMLLARAEFTLGVALAVSDAMGLKDLPGIQADLVDLIIDVETIRGCLVAAELNPEVTQAGYLRPRGLHLAPATIYAFQHRQRMAEIVRHLVGQAGVLAPSRADLSDPRMAAGLERAFGGGGYSAEQRSALLELAWDHVCSELDAREAAFEGQATQGMLGWRSRLQRWFDRYDELANGVLGALDLDMPALTLESLRDVGRPQRPGAPIQ